MRINNSTPVVGGPNDSLGATLYNNSVTRVSYLFTTSFTLLSKSPDVGSWFLPCLVWSRVSTSAWWWLISTFSPVAPGLLYWQKFNSSWGWFAWRNRGRQLERQHLPKYQKLACSCQFRPLCHWRCRDSTNPPRAGPRPSFILWDCAFPTINRSHFYWHEMGKGCPSALNIGCNA